MNTKRVLIALSVATMTAVTAQAQTKSSDSPATQQSAPETSTPDASAVKVGGPGAPPKPGPKPHEPGPGHKPNHGLTSLTTLTGTVGQWIGNDDSILDGFTVNTGSGTTTVKFPSHLGQQVQKAVKVGSNVSITGYAETGPQKDARFHMNSLTIGKTTVTDTPPPAAPAPAQTATPTTVSGKILDYRLNRDGRVTGLVLTDKTIVTIPPHVASQLADLAKKGSDITVQGYPKSLRDGQVQLEKMNILRASVLTINGQQYLVR